VQGKQPGYQHAEQAEDDGAGHQAKFSITGAIQNGYVSRHGLVQFVFGTPVVRFFPFRLVCLGEQEVFQYQIIHFRTHKTPVGVLGCADYGFATHIERGIHQNGALRPVFKRFDQPVKARVGFPVYRLYAGRIVDVGNGRNLGAGDIELIDAEQLLLCICHAQTLVLLYRRNQQHIRTAAVDFEPVRDLLRLDGRGKGSEGLAVFDLEVHG
jgi:hypothetical protein